MVLFLCFFVQLTFGLDSGGGFRASLEMRLVLRPFGLSLEAFVSFFFINPFGGLCTRKEGGFIPVPDW